jgi:hypothetical protein
MRLIPLFLSAVMIHGGRLLLITRSLGEAAFVFSQSKRLGIPSPYRFKPLNQGFKAWFRRPVAQVAFLLSTHHKQATIALVDAVDDLRDPDELLGSRIEVVALRQLLCP